MTDGKYVSTVLSNWFDSEVVDFPEDIQEFFFDRFNPIKTDPILNGSSFCTCPWGRMTPDMRRQVALLLDYEKDHHVRQQEKTCGFDQEAREIIAKQINLSEKNPPQLDSLDKIEAALKGLYDHHARMIFLKNQLLGDFKKMITGAHGTDTNQPDLSAYTPYLQAVEKLDASPEEMAAWVWAGKDNGGLNAFFKHNRGESLLRYYLCFGSADECSYQSRLLECWFLATELSEFQPAENYITGKSLIDRWKEKLKGEESLSAAFIRAKIAAETLRDINRMPGDRQHEGFNNSPYPSLNCRLFNLTDVAQIEAEFFSQTNAQGVFGAVKPPPLSQEKIKAIFKVSKDEIENDIWWRNQFRNAGRKKKNKKTYEQPSGKTHSINSKGNYKDESPMKRGSDPTENAQSSEYSQLHDCRAGPGKPGPQGSEWRPECIAVWVSEPHSRRSKKMTPEDAYAALKKIEGYKDLADISFPDLVDHD